MRLDRCTINVGAALRRSTRAAGRTATATPTVYDVDFVDPRIGVVWDVSGNARTAVKVHWGRYHEKMYTYLFDRETSGQVGDPRPGLLLERGHRRLRRLRRRRRSQPSAAMGDIDHPYVDETLLTFEQQLGKDMVIGVDLIDRRFRDIMAMVNVNDDYDADVRRPSNPLDGGTLPIYEPGLAAGVRADHRQRRLPRLPVGRCCASTSATRTAGRCGPRWSGPTSRATSLKNNGYDDEFQDRNGFTNADGSMDCPTTSGSSSSPASVDLPLGLPGSAASTPTSPAGTGRRTSRHPRPRLQRLTGRLHLPDAERGSEQLPDRNLVDLRLAWSTKLGERDPADGSRSRCFNVAQHRHRRSASTGAGATTTPTDRGTWTGRGAPTAQPTSIESPRQIRAGVRFEF